MASKCRLIDKVDIKGSKEPLELYVVDLNVTALEVRDKTRIIPWTLRQRFRARQLLEIEKRRKWADDYDVVGQFDIWPGLKSMRKRYTVDFLQLFNMGYQNYSQGEWQVARRLLNTTLDMLGSKDGPSGALLTFMETPYQFEAPVWWQGVHTLRDHV